MEIAADPEARQSAAESLELGAYSVPNRAAQSNKLKTWCDIATAAGHSDAFLPSVDLLYDVAGALWQAGYRSIDGYLSIARQHMTLERGNLPAALIINFKRASRAAARRRGPPRHAAELPFLRLGELPLIDEPLFPCCPTPDGYHRILVAATRDRCVKSDPQLRDNQHRFREHPPASNQSRDQGARRYTITRVYAHVVLCGSLSLSHAAGPGKLRTWAGLRQAHAGRTFINIET